MNATAHCRLWLLAVLWCAGAAAGADNTTGTRQSDPLLVGDFARREALVLEGNNTFTREQILRALSMHLDFHVASHRTTPLADYAALLTRKIELGYSQAGFPEAAV